MIDYSPQSVVTIHSTALKVPSPLSVIVTLWQKVGLTQGKLGGRNYTEVLDNTGPTRPPGLLQALNATKAVQFCL